MNHRINKINKKLQKKLDRERYEHTLGVMYTASALAMCHKANVEQAVLAGLLHDCAKCIPNDKKIRLCRKYHLDVSSVELQNPSLLHAKLGAFMAKKKYHVEDYEVLCAIKSHTTGKPAMTLLEKIIYIADYIEPGREELPGMSEVRWLAFHNIDECLYKMLEGSLKYLKSRKLPIDEMTEKTYRYYKTSLEKQEE